MPERGCVVLDQPQQTAHFWRTEQLAPHCGWSSTQLRSFSDRLQGRQENRRQEDQRKELLRHLPVLMLCGVMTGRLVTGKCGKSAAMLAGKRNQIAVGDLIHADHQSVRPSRSAQLKSSGDDAAVGADAGQSLIWHRHSESVGNVQILLNNEPGHLHAFHP